MSADEKLEACPFCGGAVIDVQMPVVDGDLSRYYWARAYCQSDCGFYMFGTPEHPLTLDRVNRRPLESALRAEVAKLQAEVAELKLKIEDLEYEAMGDDL